MKCMKDYIKLRSIFTKNTIWITIPWYVFTLSLCLIIFINVVKKNYIDEINILTLFWGSLLFLGLPILYTHIMKIRYYVISDTFLKYYSIGRPFGKTLYFENYIGKIETTETGSGGRYKVIYLIDRNNRTAFKIMGLHYKKFGELNNAIPLRKMDFSPTTGQYFKLLFFEKIKITETEVNKENEKRIGNAQKIIQVFALIELVCLLLAQLLKC